MNSPIAIIGSSRDDEPVRHLDKALRIRGINSRLSPPAEPREVLRWAMNLEPAQCALCVFVDTDGQLTASLATALHPAITPIAWCPPPADHSRIATILTDTPALLSIARAPETLAQMVYNLLNLTTGTSAPTAAMGATAVKNPSAKIESLIPKSSNTANPPPIDDPDHALYQQLETAMASPIKQVVKAAPVQVQKPGLDFSIPLRRLMSQGRNLAQARSHPEVLGAHYLAALDEPYLSAFTGGGLDALLVKDYLSGFDSGEDITAEPVISDEVFKAVAFARQTAREKESACVRVADFLSGLLQDNDGSVFEILKDAPLPVEKFQEILSASEAPDENCGESFFSPSSLDQAGFYQFDPTEVRDVEARLRDLPGFQKAAQRVSEARGQQAMGAGSESPASAPPSSPSPSIAAPPPDKPELLKIVGEFPSVDVIEHVTDRLLEGQMIAFPSDTMFAVAADAANPAAVLRLRAAAGFPADKPLSILIHSTSQLKHLVKADLEALEELFDELWPGPLTLVFKSAGAVGPHISPTGTVAVRQPSDNTSLAILSMLGRPLAITSWEKPHEHLAGQAAIIIDGGAPPPVRTTVVDLTQNPWQVLREGAVPGQAVLRLYNGDS